jgi:alginate O-acetyltransferase complex protein AlgJ
MPSPEVLANRADEGPDFPRRGLAERAMAVATLAVLALGVWQAAGALARPGPQARLAETLSLDAFLAGRTTAALNHVMAHDLPADGLLRAAGGVLRWAVFRSGGPQVWPGCDGWLFLAEELRPWPGGEAALARRAELVTAVARHLATQGIALQVAVVPDKARMLPEMRCGAPYSAQSEGRLAAFSAAMAGVAQVDLAAPLAPGAANFQHTDTHWNGDGARRAAAAVAAAAPGGFARETAFRTTAAAEETNGTGDLLRLMSLDAVPDALRPHPDRERVETTAPVEAAAPASLLDEAPGPEVVLLGSSFSLNANFHGALQVALSAPVTNLAKAGGGFAGAARAYFGGAAWREAPPRLVIWEFPERVLTQPLNADDTALAEWLAAR